MNLRILREGANVSLAMLSSNPWFHSPLHTYVVNQCRLVFLLDDFGFCFYQALSEITLLWFLSKDQIFEKIFVAKYSEVGAPSQVPHLGFPHLPL